MLLGRAKHEYFFSCISCLWVVCCWPCTPFVSGVFLTGLGYCCCVLLKLRVVVSNILCKYLFSACLFATLGVVGWRFIPRRFFVWRACTHRSAVLILHPLQNSAPVGMRGMNVNSCCVVCFIFIGLRPQR